MNEMTLAALLGAATWLGPKRRPGKVAEEPRPPEGDAPPAAMPERADRPEAAWAPNPLFQ